MTHKALSDPWLGIAIPIAITGASALVAPAAMPYGLAVGGSLLAVWSAARARATSNRLRDTEAALRREMMTHRELQQTITDQRQRLQIIIESEPECVKIQAADGTILDMNPAGLAIIDAQAREDIIGKAAYGYIASEYRGQYAEMTKRVFAGETATLEFRLVGFKGRQRWMESHAAPLRGPDGVVSAMLAITRDITDRRHAEEIQIQHRTVMAHMLRTFSMAEMAAAIAHELNQPLTEIVNYSRGAIRRLKSPIGGTDQVIDSLEVVSAEAERAANILRNIRSFLRKEPAQRQKKDINDVIQSLLTIMQLELRRRGIRLSVALAPGLNMIDIVPVEIEQAILNLARNSIDAMACTTDRHRELALVTRSGAGKGVEVAVSDTGPGLPPSELGDIFDPFFTTKPDGLGMGLAITRSIIEVHGGAIWVERTSSLGTTIAFSLPAATDRPDGFHRR
jgi:two-component system, LuxR family, sensor kinase FixL